MNPKKNDKPDLTTEISQDVINEAVASVERHERISSESGLHRETEAGAAPGDAQEVAAPQDEAIALQEQLKEALLRADTAEAKLKSEHERLLRSVAELENFRKRAVKEAEDARKYAGEKLLRDVLPVYDNLERAIAHALSAEDFSSFKTGVEMIRKLLTDTLERHHFKAFTATGEAFDPSRHEAVGTEPAEAMPANQVVREVVKGFMLHDRLIRPALVVVSQEKKEVAGEITDAPANKVDGSETAEGNEST